MRLSPPGLDLCPTGPGVWGAASGGKRGVRSPLLVTAPRMVLTRHEDNVRAQGVGRAVPPGPAGRAAQPSSLTGTGPGSSRPVSLCDTITHPPPWLHFNVVLPGRSPPRVPPSEACSQASSCLWGTSSPVPLSQVQGGGPGLHVTPGVLAPVLWGPSCLLPAGSFQPRGPRCPQTGAWEGGSGTPCGREHSSETALGGPAPGTLSVPCPCLVLCRPRLGCGGASLCFLLVPTVALPPPPPLPGCISAVRAQAEGPAGPGLLKGKGGGCRRPPPCPGATSGGGAGGGGAGSARCAPGALPTKAQLVRPNFHQKTKKKMPARRHPPHPERRVLVPSAPHFVVHPQSPLGRAVAASPTCSPRHGTTPSAWTRPPDTCGAWGAGTTRRGGGTALPLPFRPPPPRGSPHRPSCGLASGQVALGGGAAWRSQCPMSPPRLQDTDLGRACQGGPAAGRVGRVPRSLPLLPALRQRQGEEAGQAEER